MSDLLQTFLATRDTPCPGCGYNLRQLTGSICPECGDHLELKVNLAEPRLGAWITGLIGAACGAGFNGLLLFYVAVTMIVYSRGTRGIPGSFILINAGGLLIMGLILLIWIRGRGRFRRTPVGIKAALILGTWLLAAADVVVFAVYIR